MPQTTLKLSLSFCIMQENLAFLIDRSWIILASLIIGTVYVVLPRLMVVNLLSWKLPRCFLISRLSDSASLYGYWLSNITFQIDLSSSGIHVPQEGVTLLSIRMLFHNALFFLEIRPISSGGNRSFGSVVESFSSQWKCAGKMLK